MKLDDPNRKVKVGTIGLWAIFAIVTVVMIALVFGEVFRPYDYWIPIIPIGILLILSVMATIVDFRSEQRIKIGVIGVWTIFLITTVVMAALMIGEVFTADEYWIPVIPIGTLFVLALIITILEYISGEVRYCHKCGKIFDKKWDYCQECGARVLMACPTCGMKVKGNPKFCYKCGTDLSKIKVEQVYRPPAKPKVNSEANFCRECGSIANPEAKYCGYCGAAHA